MQVNLVMFKPDGRRKDFPLSSANTVIGRRQDCGLQIPLVGVSRQHCEVIVSGREVKVKDLQSSNGTYVNDKRVEEQALKAGDRITIGSVIFTVQIDGRPPVVKPASAKRKAVTDDDVAMQLMPDDEDEDAQVDALDILNEGQDEDDDK